MRSISLFTLVLLLAMTATAQSRLKSKSPARSGLLIKAKCESNGLTQPEITELLAAHNRARAEQKLAPLVWDCLLANVAENWARRGVFAHRGDTSYGENIFVSSNPSEPVSTVVKTWLGEKGNWTNKTAACAIGKVCTHYTQVMWNATNLVGCGINRNAPGRWKTLVVCNYSPAGNSGGRPY